MFLLKIGVLYPKKHAQPERFAHIRLETENLQLTHHQGKQRIVTIVILVITVASLVTFALVYLTRSTRRTPKSTKQKQ